MKRTERKYRYFWMTGLIAAMILAGCAQDEEAAEEEEDLAEEDVAEEEPEAEEEEEEEAGTEEQQEDEAEEDNGEAFPVTLTDDAGNEVTIEEEPEEIISIQASFTETLFELGVGDRLIGVSDFCNYPEETEDIETVGGQDMNDELILSLLPDLVFVTDYHYENHGATLEQFEEAGIDVFVVGSTESFDGVYDKISLMGEAVGVNDEAADIIEDMQTRYDEIAEEAEAVEEEKTVWVEVSPEPDIFTTGQNTFMHEMLELIEAENAAAEEEGWISITEEEAVQFDPDVILTTYHSDDVYGDIASREGWEEVPAVAEERIYEVEEDTVVRPGPRLIEGVETLAELVYPDIFAE
ncbi:ABC transporter substrate-binding protein [Salsuginibacillus kocurii]|uniref:ABC transporter substrate-binding protein n=1 Tax=Salsuginibacillus kocurii TaxID=427078 RepID=UPI00037F812B|nr:ABC transporter substrate-binding protein [Salsuginibacillus kocurii]